MAWTNKKRIKIARGRHSAILSSTATQAEGQLVYDEDTHYLTVGTLDKNNNEKIVKYNVPIRVRTVEGYCSDEETFSGIANGKDDEYTPNKGSSSSGGHYRLCGVREGIEDNVYLYAGGFPQIIDPGVNLKLVSSGNVSITSGTEKTISISNGDISTSSGIQIDKSNIIFGLNGTQMLNMQRDTTANTNKILVDGVVPIELCDGSLLRVQRTNMVGNYSDISTTQLSAFDETGTGLTFKRSGTRWGSKTYTVSLYAEGLSDDNKTYLCTTNSPPDSSNDNTLATTAFVHNLMGFKSHRIINAFPNITPLGSYTVVGRIYRQGKLLFGYINQPLAYDGKKPINKAKKDEDTKGVWLWKNEAVSWRLAPDSEEDDPASLFLDESKGDKAIFQVYMGIPGYQEGARVQWFASGDYAYYTVDGLLNVKYNLATGEFTPYLTGHTTSHPLWQSINIFFYIDLNE